MRRALPSAQAMATRIRHWCLCQATASGKGTASLYASAEKRTESQYTGVIGRLGRQGTEARMQQVEKAVLGQQDKKAAMPSEKPAKTPAEDGRHKPDQHRDDRHMGSGHKARAAAQSAATKVEAGAKPAAEHGAKKKKPAVELDDLRERALSSRRPAAMQEAPAAAAGVRIAMYMTISVVTHSKRGCSQRPSSKTLQMLCSYSKQLLARQSK